MQLPDDMQDVPALPATTQRSEPHDSDDMQWLFVVQVAPFPPQMPELHPRGDSQLLDEAQDAPTPAKLHLPETHEKGDAQ